LVILGRLYAVTNNAQSLKMFEAASGLAVKMRSDTLCRLTSELMRNNEFDL
jgi:hypothetical protein